MGVQMIKANPMTSERVVVVSDKQVGRERRHLLVVPRVVLRSQQEMELFICIVRESAKGVWV